MKAKLPALGIDLGGTKMVAAVISDTKLISDARRIATPTGSNNIVRSILDLIADFQKTHVLAGIGIATAGIVNVETGAIVGSTGNLPGWEGTHLKTVLEGRTMLPVHVENDANAAAYGESRAAHLGNKECIVAVTLGTGIGTGIVVKGKLYYGAHWAAGECGHIRINLENSRLCTCGLWDCWEAYASGRGFLTTAREELAHLQLHQSKLVEKKETVTVEDVIAAQQNNDLVATRIIHRWHEHICAGMVTLCHTLDPDCFLMSGGMSKFVNYSLLKEMLTDKTLPRVGERLEIHPSSLGTQAGMIGAACLMIDSLREFSH